MFTNIDECIDFIQSQHRTSSKSLDHMKKLCNAYSNPEKGIKFIHVAGTNGKGSIVSYLREILYNSSINVGTFTSPYIECFNERITYNKQYISDKDILKYSNQIIDKYDYLDKEGIERPSFFSFITLMSFMYFKDKKVDVAIIEVGIGGLLDCTNVITPILSIISNVSYDHMNVLGNTILEIAKNKLGIVKENIPLITLDNPLINDIIISTCLNKSSELFLVKKEDIKNVNVSTSETIFSYKDYKNVSLSLLGRYQAENASIVLESIKILKKYFMISNETIIYSLKHTFWPGRLEIVRKDPLIILDGAHNIDGINRLHEFIKEMKVKTKVLVLAISSNKETFKMVREIEQDVDEIIFTEFNYKRSEEGNVLYEYSLHKNKHLASNIDSPVMMALDNKDSDTAWIFSGSLYFVSEIRTKFKTNN